MTEGQVGKAYRETLLILAALIFFLVFWLTAGIGTFFVFTGVFFLSVGVVSVLRWVLSNVDLTMGGRLNATYIIGWCVLIVALGICLVAAVDVVTRIGNALGLGT
jgi:phosphate starvation-inducible membrane PsiE